MVAEVAGETGALLAGLRQEVDIYRKILGVSTEELKLVKEAELEKATGALSQKQKMLEEIAIIEKNIQPVKARWPQIKPTLAPDLLSSFQAALKELSDLLEELIAIERQTEDILSQQISIVRKGVGASVTEERARKAYGAKPAGEKAGESKDKG